MKSIRTALALLVAAATQGGPSVEQTVQGSRAALPVLASFDGLGVGFVSQQPSQDGRNPSDNSLAVGPNHIVQIVNSRFAVFTKKGAMFDTTGKLVYGAVPTNTLFAGFGGQCEARNNGDAVVRYDQLAGRWLYVMPIFRRPANDSTGPYSMCYAVSQGPDPAGPFYRYEFKRPLFPDYPRPAVWPDGYYIPTSTSDNIIQKHVCVVEREKMLKGLPAREQCRIVDGVNFLNNADIDGQAVPPKGAPNIMMAAGGAQLKNIFEDDGIYYWKFHVDWNDTAKTTLTGPEKIAVAPYHYLCNGQLTNCVPQPGTDRRLDAQGDKIMQRLVYRRVNGHESIVALHSVNTAAGGGGVRWYEFRLDNKRPCSISREPLRRTAFIAGCRASEWIARETLASATRSVARRTSRASALPRASPMTRPENSPFASRFSSRARDRKRTRCDGRTTPPSPWIRAMTAPSGTSAITTRRTPRPTPRALARSS
jgi:hypothetical protein